LHDDGRIRILEAQKHVDPVDPDPDPEHCLRLWIRLKEFFFGRKRRQSGKKRSEKSAWRCTMSRFLLMVSESDICSRKI
jgi:hypothetical protein